MYLKKGRIYLWCAPTPENGGTLTTHCILVRVIYSRLRCLTTVRWLCDSDSSIDKLPGYKIIRKSAAASFSGYWGFDKSKTISVINLEIKCNVNDTRARVLPPDTSSFWFWRQNKFAKCVQNAARQTRFIVLYGVIKT